MSPNEPSYFAVIPANVRYCKDLEPNAKLLYGEITSLCNKQGYCWASNKYFHELYDVDERTIQRWIKSLVKNNFIHVEYDVDAKNKSIRKIFINNNPQIIVMGDKNVTGDKIVGGGTTKMSEPSYNKNTTSEVVVGKEPPSFSVEVVHKPIDIPENKITKDDVYRHSLRADPDWSSQEIEAAWSAFLAAKTPISDPIKYIAGIINKKRALSDSKNKEKTCQNNNSNSTQTAILHSKEESESIKKAPSELDLSAHPLAELERQLYNKIRLQNS